MIKNVAIIGAGISGITLAQALLASQKFHVTLFEKSRGVGGRMATKRIDPFQFDHGYQYSTQPSLLDGASLHPWGSFYTPFGSSNALCKSLSAGLAIELNTEISHVHRDQNQWWLQGLDRRFGPYDLLFITAPPAQTYKLLPSHVTFKEDVAKAHMSPCFALMVGFQSTVPCPWFSLDVNTKIIAKIFNQSSKPGRSVSVASFVAHSQPDWAEQVLETDPTLLEAEMVDDFFRATAFNQSLLTVSKIHRWRYATVKTPLNKNYLWCSTEQIGVCGDWLLGPDATHAVASAKSLAQYIANE